jgi:hypothetical protein
MSRIRILLVLVATIALNAFGTEQPALHTQVDRSVAPVKIAVPLAPPERTIVRLNGTDALTQKLLPAVVAQSKLGKAKIDRWNIPNGSGSFVIMGFGATWKTYLSDISLEVPVNANSLTSEFKSAPSNRGEIDTNYSFEDAKLKLTFHVKTNPNSPLDSMVPSQVKEWTTISDNFRITVTGIAGALDVTLKKSAGFVAVDSVDRFTIRADHVSVADSARLIELADNVASLSKLFGVPGATSVDDAAIKLANVLLKEELEVRKDLRDAMNDALEQLTSMEFGAQKFSVGRGASLALTDSLMALRTTSGQAVTEWSVAIEGEPSGAAPQLSYVPVARPAEDIDQLAARGDVELFVPYSLVDKTMYELVQMGTLGKITVPRSSTSGIKVGFDIVAEPMETPRVEPAPDDPNALVVTFAARLGDSTIGTIDTGVLVPRAPSDSPGGRTVPPVPDSVPVNLTGASARVAIIFRLQATDRGGLDLNYVGLELNDLTGSLSAASVSTPLNRLQTPLRNAIDAHLRRTMPRISLIQSAVRLIPGVRVRVDEPRRGVRYLGLPLTLIVD